MDAVEYMLDRRAMPLTDRVRPRIGDVVEVSTPAGLAYAQFTHKHDEPPKFGALIRVFPGLHERRPKDFAAVLQQRPLFSTFFPLGAACNRGIVKIVAEERVPQHLSDWPTFRNAPRREPGRAKSGPWFLFDGKREWKVESLSEDQLREYPPLAVWNDTLLIERIVSGWRHEDG